METKFKQGSIYELEKEFREKIEELEERIKLLEGTE